jgi:hypothetical protein
MQDFDLELLEMGADHSQKVKAAHITSDYSSKDCVTLSSSTAVSRLIHPILTLSNTSAEKDFQLDGKMF